MNIKKAEELSGVSRQNIRFYEREGLLAPDRNPENDYREYNEKHIHVLKQIRAMRLMDMPLDQIRLDLVVTKEGMYPEFTINGIEYTAERFYTVVARVPVATIRCSVKYPEDFAPEVPEKRKKFMKLLHLGWLPAVFILASLGVILMMRGQGLLRSWEGWLIVLSLLALSAVSLYRTWLFYYNNKH